MQVPSGEAVTEHVKYTEVDNHWDRPEIAPGAALMFCWGTLAPWKAYVEAHAAVHGTGTTDFTRRAQRNRRRRSQSREEPANLTLSAPSRKRRVQL